MPQTGHYCFFFFFSLFPSQIIIFVSFPSFHPIQVKGKEEALMQLTPFFFFFAQEPVIITNICTRYISEPEPWLPMPFHLLCTLARSPSASHGFGLLLSPDSKGELTLPARVLIGLPQSEESQWKKKRDARPALLLQPTGR